MASSSSTEVANGEPDRTDDTGECGHGCLQDALRGVEADRRGRSRAEGQGERAATRSYRDDLNLAERGSPVAKRPNAG